MKAVIIEYDIDFGFFLEEKVKWICNRIMFPLTVEKVNNVDEILQSKIVYDIYFISIQMPEMTGVAIAEALRRNGVNSEIVFVSGHESCMKSVFHIKPIGFLLKNMINEDLEKVLRILKKELLKSNIIMIKDNRSDYAIHVDNVLCFKSEGHYIDIIFIDHTKKIIRNNMKSLEEILRGSHFIRIHNRYYVNLHCIDRYENGQVFLSTGEGLPVSRGYSGNIKDLIVR